MADVKNSDSCKSCLFFFSGDRMGICKRYPQNVNKSNEDWCGEWQYPQSKALEIMTDTLSAVESSYVKPIKKRGRPAKK